MIRAAGVLFLAPADRALFVRRSAAGDMAGTWCIPGGKLEGDETAEEAARREVTEEVGLRTEFGAALLSRTVSGGVAAPAVAAVPAAAPPTAPSIVPPAEPLVGAAAIPQTDQVDFTTFVARLESEFTPRLNDEHDAYVWADVSNPPRPLHPGCAISLKRMGSDELGVARMMQAGELVSPQLYRNVTLFKIRITGTGVAYRPSLNEFTYRRPEHYLTPDFLARCAGLSVIMLHPKKAVMDSKEFSDRIVGSMLLPFIEGDEVWGVAKIYDDDAIKLMRNKVLSTSPSVVLRNVDSKKLKLEDGATLLIEGKPALLDHLAICEHGVWDKGEGPTGVISVDSEGETAMADEDKKVEDKKADGEVSENLKKDAAKADADGGVMLDKILECVDGMSKKMDAMGSRMDAFEEKEKEKADGAKADAARKDEPAEREEMSERIKEESKKKDSAKKDTAKADAKKDENGEPEDVMADKGKKDSAKADADKEEEKKDTAKADSVSIADVQRMIADGVAKHLPEISDTDERALLDAQARADTAYQAFGQQAPKYLRGESLRQYRRRLAEKLQGHSPRFGKSDLGRILDDTTFAAVEESIYADAMTAAMSPAGLGDGELRSIVTTDPTGRRITTFAGEPKAWMSQFTPPKRRMVGISNKGQ